MTLLCRPRGRGNWTIITVHVSLAPDMFRARPGEIIKLCGLELRIVSVTP